MPSVVTYTTGRVFADAIACCSAERGGRGSFVSSGSVTGSGSTCAGVVSSTGKVPGSADAAGTLSLFVISGVTIMSVLFDDVTEVSTVAISAQPLSNIAAAIKAAMVFLNILFLLHYCLNIGIRFNIV